MTIATGVNKVLAYKKEGTQGLAAGIDAAQLLRRLTSSLDLTKDTYKSNEIRPDLQRNDFRHGMRSVSGSINGEVSCGTWLDFMSAAVRGPYSKFTAISGLSISTTAGQKFTRGTGSWLTDGVKIGDVVRFSGFTGGNTALNANFVVSNLTALDLFGFFLNGTAIPAISSGTPATGIGVTMPGKKTFTPLTNQTDDTFSIEHWFKDIGQSELFLGCKPSQVNFNLPSTGMAEVEFQFMGRDFADTTAKRTSDGLGGGSNVALTSQYFSTNLKATSTGASMAAVNGLLIVGGTAYKTVTGVNISLNGNVTTGQVVGSNFTPDVFEGSIDVTGQLTAYFEDASLRDLFVNEVEASLVIVMAADNTATSDFVAINLPRIKVGGSSKDDGEKGLIQTVPFTALLGNKTGVDATTLIYQDSTAP